jgi:ABC-type xylose transport system substrate-binding protein
VLVSQEFHRAWDPALGLKQVEQALARTGNKLDAILCNYDGFALAILPALESAGLLGKTWIGGNDVFLEMAQAMVAGTANQSGYTDLEDMANKAVAAAHALATGQTPDSDDTVNNGAAEVPGSRIKSYAVTSENLCQFLKDTNWLDPAEVYANAPSGQTC